MPATSPKITRRQFSKQSVIAAGTTLASTCAMTNRGQAKVPPSERINIGVIGLGGMGRGHLGGLRAERDVEIIAICDVENKRLEEVKSKFTDRDVAAHRDFRELLTNDEIDAVLIATPDHWHGLIAIAAARAGKDIYCEKPLTNSIVEGRAVCDAVTQNHVILQTGSHERSNPGAIVAKKLIAEGRFGEIHTVRIQLPTDDKHLQEVKAFSGTPDEMQVPAGFDYDFWLGHTPAAPYTERRCHFWWRFISNYGGGEMTDRGCHVIDLAQMILNNDHTGPTSINALGEPPISGLYDACLDFRFENRFASGLRMIGNNNGPRGVWFEGTEGKLFVKVHGGDLTAEPASLLADIKLPLAKHHAQHRRLFLDAIKTRTQANAPAEAGHRTATVCHLNNIALRLGRSFEWNPDSEQSSDPEVNALLKPKMRSPWKLED